MSRPEIGNNNGGCAAGHSPGPGFIAGSDCHFVIETNPGSPNLGRVISEGQADENTGIPTSVLGLGTERILRSPAEGRLVSLKGIGDRVEHDDIVGYVDSSPIMAPISGCTWGLVRNGFTLKEGQKIGDIDPRGRRKLCFEIAPESRRIADGVMEGMVTFLSKQNGCAVNNILTPGPMRAMPYEDS